MSLRLRVEFNKGRIGIPIGKLARITRHVGELLASLSRDVGVPSQPEDWLAENFENNSVDFDLRSELFAAPDTRALALRCLRALLSENLADDDERTLLSRETLREYRLVAAQLEPGETARFGLYRNGGEEPSEWFEMSHSVAQELVGESPVREPYWGEIQGLVHAFFKESKRPHLQVRELASDRLVNCFFTGPMYAAAVDVLKEREAVVFVEGWVREDSETGFAREIDAMDFRLAPDFDWGAFDRMIGSAPWYTGEMTAEEFVQRGRHGRA